MVACGLAELATIHYMVKRWLPRIGCLLLLVLLTTSATLRIKFSMPTLDDADTTCVTHQFIPVGPVNPGLRVIWKYWLAGGDSINAVRDSINGSPGTVELRDYTVAVGVYRVRAWAVDGGGKSCDTVVTIQTFKYRPWRPVWIAP